MIVMHTERVKMRSPASKYCIAKYAVGVSMTNYVVAKLMTQLLARNPLFVKRIGDAAAT